MKRAIFPVLLAFAAACAATDPSTTEGTAGERVKNTLKTTVVVHYPTGWGHRISIRGNGAGLDWGHGLDATWTDGDAWTVALDMTAAIEWKPLFDDRDWSKGPNYTLAPGQTADIWPVFYHDAGRLETRASWTSKVLGNTRDIVVYLPPSYDENFRERYPVVYMHDGQNLFDDSKAFGGVSWDVAGAMNRGFTNATLHEAIIVGIDNTPARISEYTPVPDPDDGGGGADAYLTFIVTELKPAIDRDYRTLPDRQHTAIAGSSLGGLVSAYAGVAHPETFGLVGAFSPSTWWDGTWILGRVATSTMPLKVHVDSGDSGPSSDDKDNTAKLAQTYRDHGATVNYVLQHGASHNEYWWKQRLPGALVFLLGGR